MSVGRSRRRRRQVHHELSDHRADPRAPTMRESDQFHVVERSPWTKARIMQVRSAEYEKMATDYSAAAKPCTSRTVA